MRDGGGQGLLGMGGVGGNAGMGGVSPQILSQLGIEGPISSTVFVANVSIFCLTGLSLLRKLCRFYFLKKTFCGLNIFSFPIYEDQISPHLIKFRRFCL